MFLGKNEGFMLNKKSFNESLKISTSDISVFSYLHTILSHNKNRQKLFFGTSSKLVQLKFFMVQINFFLVHYCPKKIKNKKQ